MPLEEVKSCVFMDRVSVVHINQTLHSDPNISPRPKAMPMKVKPSFVAVRSFVADILLPAHSMMVKQILLWQRLSVSLCTKTKNY